jgi:hypothetical protein
MNKRLERLWLDVIGRLGVVNVSSVYSLALFSENIFYIPLAFQVRPPAQVVG